MSSSLDGLHKRIDKMIDQERERQYATAALSEKRAMVRLPIKDDMPPVSYEHLFPDSIIQFYGPEHRQEEGFS